MYSPYLFARSSELLSLRDIASTAPDVRRLLPILEPVNANLSSLSTCLDIWHGDIVVIMNPYQNEFSGNPHAVQALYTHIQGLMNTKPNIIIGILVTASTNFQSLIQYINSNQNRRIALIYDNASLSDAEISSLSSLSSVHYHVILNNTLHHHQYGLLPISKIIVVNDCFRKLARNADYNGPEPFTNLNQYVGSNFLGFGDYTITGRVFAPGGGQPSAVAAHLIYKEITSNSIWIRHFVSANTQRGGADVATMFLDVSDQITQFVPQHINQFGNNIGLGHYYDCSNRRHSPGLAKNKEYQISHHISFMLDLLNGRI
jgi:hypothetical protein